MSGNVKMEVENTVLRIKVHIRSTYGIQDNNRLFANSSRTADYR